MNLLKKIYQTTWNWQLRSHLDNCAWALVKAGYVIGVVHSTFGIFSSPQYIMFMFSFSRFFQSVTLWCFLSLILSDEDKIELAVINPAYVMGPVINGSMSTSSEVSRSTKQKKTTNCISQSDSSLSYHLSNALGVCFLHIPGEFWYLIFTAFFIIFIISSLIIKFFQKCPLIVKVLHMAHIVNTKLALHLPTYTNINCKWCRTITIYNQNIFMYVLYSIVSLTLNFGLGDLCKHFWLV